MNTLSHCITTTCLELQKLYKRLVMYLIALLSAVVNEATGDNSSANDSSPPFSPLAAIQAQLRIATTENSDLRVNDIPGAMVKATVDQCTVSKL